MKTQVGPKKQENCHTHTHTSKNTPTDTNTITHSHKQTSEETQTRTHRQTNTPAQTHVHTLSHTFEPVGQMWNSSDKSADHFELDARARRNDASDLETFPKSERLDRRQSCSQTRGEHGD